MAHFLKFRPASVIVQFVIFFPIGSRAVDKLVGVIRVKHRNSLQKLLLQTDFRTLELSLFFFFFKKVIKRPQFEAYPIFNSSMNLIVLFYFSARRFWSCRSLLLNSTGTSRLSTRRWPCVELQHSRSYPCSQSAELNWDLEIVKKKMTMRWAATISLSPIHVFNPLNLTGISRLSKSRWPWDEL